SMAHPAMQPTCHRCVMMRLSFLPQAGSARALHRVRGFRGCQVRMLALWAVRADNGGVLTMAEPQVWTLIGVLIVALFGMLTLMSTLFTRVIRTEIGGLRREMDSRFGRVDARFDGV